MSSRDPRRRAHQHQSRDSSSPVPSSSSRKHRSEGKKSPQRHTTEQPRRSSPHHASSNKRSSSRRSPSPPKHRAKRHKDQHSSASPPKDDPSHTHRIPTDPRTPPADISSGAANSRTLLLKQKLSEKRMKRQDEERAIAEDDDDVSSWVERSRKLELVRREEKASVARGGVSEGERYLSKDLKGLKVGHKLDGFMEGEYTVLTLQDRQVLDEGEEETLENLTMVDQDKASRSREVRAGEDYDPYEDIPGQEGELDRVERALRGENSSLDVLSKYDEEISGVKTHSFHLSTDGHVDTNSCDHLAIKKREDLLAQLGKKEVDLNVERRFASQVMTTEEIAVKFRKIKKRRKVVPLRPDDLLPDSAPSAPLPGDLGSRTEPSSQPPISSFRGRTVKNEELVGPAAIESDDVTTSDVLPADEGAIASAKERIRRLRESAFSRKQMDPVERAAAIANQARRISPQSLASSEDKPPAKSMIFDSTQEFVRSLNTHSNSNSSNTAPVNRRRQEISQKSDSDDDMDLDADGEKDGWKELKNGDAVNGRVKNEEDGDSYFDAEPIVSHSLTSALLLAERKGFIDKKSNSSSAYTEAIANPRDKNDISARNYSLMDKQNKSGERERDRDRDRGRDRDLFARSEYRDRDSSFPDLKAYVPEIKLEYVDDLGRDLSQKEAFRRMSHIFHGKGSGKMKTERRIKKAEDELSMMKMNSFDTPLNTVAMATRKMENSGTPYLILSGGQHSLEASSVGPQSGLVKGKK